MARGPCILIGLDAFDPTLALEWAGAGHLPAIATLLDRGGRCRVENPFGVFVGAVWVNFASAQRADRHQFHCWDRIGLDDYRWDGRFRPPRPFDSFWRKIGHSGRRVAAIDVPHTRAPETLNGVEVAEWGCHDRHFGLHSIPAPRARALADRFGLHPVLGADPFRERHFSPDDFVHRKGRYRTQAEDRALLEGLKAGAALKGRLLAETLTDEAWDLFIGVFGESHAVGHQLWHLHDAGHRRFDPDRRAALGGDPVLQVYREIDAALGRLLAGAGPDGTILVLLSHGMTLHHDGTHLLEEVLARLDADEAGDPMRRRVRSMLKPALPFLQEVAIAWRVPARLRRACARVLRGTLPRRRARQRFFAAPNNSVFGGIRINLAGREAHGKVPPEDYDRVCAALEKDLLDLVNLDTGGPVVRVVERSDRHHVRSPRDSLPDLFVEWERSAPVERIFSPRIGVVHTPDTHWRSGDHQPDGLLLAMGRDIPAGSSFSSIRIEDIGPSIAARLDVRVEDCDGAEIGWLSGRSDADPEAMAKASRG